MSNKVNMNRYLDEDLKESLNASIKVNFFYKEDDETHISLFQKQDFEKKILLSNFEDSWDFLDKGLGVKVEIELENPLSLFGEEKLINSDGELGLAIQWVSKQSQQRNVHAIATVSSTTKKNEKFIWTRYFEKESLFGELELSIILYVKKVAEQINFGHPKLTGIVLGRLDKWEVILDGSGSTFPIVFVDEPNMPLWYIDFNYSDPLIEPFDKEYIAIYVNKSHDAFGAILRPKTKADKALYVEFLAGALHVIYQSLEESGYWKDIQNGDKYEEGSIAEVIHYFMITLELHYDTPENLAISLRKYLEARVKTGEL